MPSSPVRRGGKSSRSDPAWQPCSLLRLQPSPGLGGLPGKQMPFTSVASCRSQVLPGYRLCLWQGCWVSVWVQSQ